MKTKESLVIIKQVIDQSIKAGIWAKSEDVVTIHNAFLQLSSLEEPELTEGNS